MRIDVFCYLIVAILAVLPTLRCAENNDKMLLIKCDPSDLGHTVCGENQRCHATVNGTICVCQRDFFPENNKCVKIIPTAASINATALKPEFRSRGSSIAAGLLIPTFLIAIGVFLYYCGRRHKWLQRFRQYRHNRYGNVLVTRDDDDDDPPIA